MEIKERFIVSKLNKDDMRAYGASLKDKRDLKNAMDTALAEGMEKGMEKKAVEIAIHLKKRGMPVEEIGNITGLSIDQINEL